MAGAGEVVTNMTVKHRNDGLRKVCGCRRRKWVTCAHPWHFNYKWNGVAYRFSLDRQLGRRLLGKTDAKNAADALRLAIRAGTFRDRVTVPPTPGVPPVAAVTFATFAEKYLERATPKKARDRDAWKQETTWQLNRVKAFALDGTTLGDKTLTAITEDDLEAFIRELRVRGRAVSTRNHYVQLFGAMFRWATKKGYLDRNPIGTDAELRREKPRRRDRRLQEGEEQLLLAAAAPHLHALIVAALETTCRLGELLKLQWKDIALDRRELTVRAENAKDNKTRVLPISSRLHAVLEMRRTDAAGQDFGPDAFVLGDSTGGQVTTIKRAWETANLKAHGHTPVWLGRGRLSPECRARLRSIDLHFHDLRHEAGSRLLEGKFPLHHVQQMLGHADLSTTSIYLNATRQGLQESMKKLDEDRNGCKPVANETTTEHRLSCNDDPKPIDKSLIN